MSAVINTEKVDTLRFVHPTIQNVQPIHYKQYSSSLKMDRHDITIKSAIESAYNFISSYLSPAKRIYYIRLNFLSQQSDDKNENHLFSLKNFLHEYLKHLIILQI